MTRTTLCTSRLPQSRIQNRLGWQEQRCLQQHDCLGQQSELIVLLSSHYKQLGFGTAWS